jgi:hypothetical protein
MQVQVARSVERILQGLADSWTLKTHGTRHQKAHQKIIQTIYINTKKHRYKLQHGQRPADK